MKVQLVSIDKVKPNPSNPRVIRDEKFMKLVRSIEDFPEMLSQARPLVCNKDMEVLGGNMRLRACQEAGLKKVPVVVVEWTKKKQEEFIIKDNLGFGEWDWDKLANEWDAELLTEWGMDIPEPQTIEAIEGEDDVPELTEDPISKPGDIWILGNHRIICGDSADGGTVSLVLNGDKASLVFTDPPYGVSIGKKNKMLNSFQKAGRNLRDIKDDDLKPEQLKEMLLPAFQNIREIVMADDCTIFVTAPQNGELGMMMMMMMEEAGLRPRHVLIWKKNSPTFSMGRLDYDYQHEPILLTWGKKHKRPMKGNYRTSVWEIEKPRSSKEHPTMKPVELYENALLNNSDNGDIVYDAYSGSGTMIIAAEKTGRKARVIEIDPHYVDVAIKRWQEFTGKKAKLESNGRPFEEVSQD